MCNGVIAHARQLHMHSNIYVAIYKEVLLDFLMRMHLDAHDTFKNLYKAYRKYLKFVDFMEPCILVKNVHINHVDAYSTTGIYILLSVFVMPSPNIVWPEA